MIERSRRDIERPKHAAVRSGAAGSGAERFAVRAVIRRPVDTSTGMADAISTALAGDVAIAAP